MATSLVQTVLSASDQSFKAFGVALRPSKFESPRLTSDLIFEVFDAAPLRRRPETIAIDLHSRQVMITPRLRVGGRTFRVVMSDPEPARTHGHILAVGRHHRAIRRSAGWQQHRHRRRQHPARRVRCAGRDGRVRRPAGRLCGRRWWRHA